MLASLAVLATATVLTQLGLGGGTGTKLIALVIIAGLIVLAGVVGFSLIMRLQTVITIVTGALTSSTSSWSSTRWTWRPWPPCPPAAFRP